MSSAENRSTSSDLMEEAGVLGSTMGAVMASPEMATALSAMATLSVSFMGTLVLGGLVWLLTKGLTMVLGKSFQVIRWQNVKDLFGLDDRLPGIVEAVEGILPFDDFKEKFVNRNKSTSTTTTPTTTPAPTTVKTSSPTTKIHHHYYNKHRGQSHPYFSPQLAPPFRNRWGFDDYLNRENEIRNLKSN